MGERYSDYDVFARMYDRHWGKQGAGHLELLDEHVLLHVPRGARILDLCCGTGQLAEILTDRGYRVIGLDGSAAMIEYARRNAPAAEFVVADARDFRFAEPFDAVLCMFDSLNHLMEEKDLEQAFRCVSTALDAGGLFAFDLNMEAKYLHTWTGDFSVVEDEEACIVRAGVLPSERIGWFETTLFYEEGSGAWSRHDLRLVQTWYDRETVARLLGSAGFAAPQTRVKESLPDDRDVAANLLFVTTKEGAA